MNDRDSFSRDDKNCQPLRAELVGKLGSWEVDLGRKTLTWSDGVFSIFQVAREDFDGTEEAFFDMIHPDDRDGFLKARKDWHVKGGAFVFEHRIVTPAGEIKWVVERAQIIANAAGAPEFTTGTVQDVTDLKQAELARAVAEREVSRQARLRKLAGRLARLGSWHVDLQKRLITWDEETAAIHDEPEGTSLTLDEGIQYYVPEHRDRIRAQFEACATEGRPFDDTLQIETAKGRRVWVHALGEAIRDAGGAIIAVEGAFQDISELVAARDEAEDLAMRLRKTLEDMSDAFYLLDNKWRFVFLNSTAERLLQRNREELLGEVIWDKFPEAAGQVRQPFELASRENRMVRFEEIYPPREKWFEVSANPTAAGLAVYFRDITEHRARDAQLRLLEAAAAKLNDILLITEAEPIDGPDGPRIVYVNNAFERRTGFSPDEAIGQTPRILQGPKTDRAELGRIRDALERWQPVRSELVNYTKSGEEFWLELDIVPLADGSGRFTHWIAVERDITDRRQREEDLATNEQRFRLIAKASGTTIWEWDIAEGKQWWSEGLEDIFGHTPDPLQSVPTIWSAHVHEDDAERVEAALHSLVSGEIETLHELYRFRRGDGSWAWVEDRAFVIRNSYGAPTRVLGSLTDISERRELEQQLRQTQKLEAIGQLTGGIAHDFNNILAVIMGNAELLEEDLEDGTELLDMAGEIVGAAQRGAQLTSRLLAFARKQALEPVVANLNSAVLGIMPLLKRGLGDSVEVEVNLSEELWLVEIDPGQLESALLNLALNARDAMPQGGKLTIETHNTEIDSETALAIEIEEGRFVLVAVTDTGCGISAADIERVLEPFYTTKDRGSGLGLPMVFGFVKQSGGHLKIYSERNEGTTVKLYFPQAVPGAAEAGRGVATGDTPKGRGEHVLVVEDDPNVRRNVVSMVRSLDYRVTEAEDAASALDLLERNADIELLLTDVVMPGGMNGRELADAALRRYPDLRVIFSSGYTENAIVHQGRLDPGVQFLPKPYLRQALAVKLRVVLDRPHSGS